MDPQEPVSVSLPRGAWNVILQHLWKYATCEVGVPLVETIRAQVDKHETMVPLNGDKKDA